MTVHYLPVQKKIFSGDYATCWLVAFVLVFYGLRIWPIKISRRMYEKGPPKHATYLLKSCVFILICLNFSHLQSTLHLIQHTYQDVFCTAQNSFWTCRFGCLIMLLSLFCFTSSTLAKCFPLRTVFIPRNKKTICPGQDRVSREGGEWRSCHFGPKSAEHSAQCGQVCS